MSRELTDARAYFISLVDRPANRRPFLIIKSDENSIDNYINPEAWEVLKQYPRHQVEQIVKAITENRKHQILKASDRPFELWEIRMACKSLKISKPVTFKGLL